MTLVLAAAAAGAALYAFSSKEIPKAKEDYMQKHKTTGHVHDQSHFAGNVDTRAVWVDQKVDRDLYGVPRRALIDRNGSVTYTYNMYYPEIKRV